LLLPWRSVKLWFACGSPVVRPVVQPVVQTVVRTVVACRELYFSQVFNFPAGRCAAGRPKNCGRPESAVAQRRSAATPATLTAARLRQ
jgi:hypothetical protein